jgi:transcriptional regulator with XRE-family HTH domain
LDTIPTVGYRGKTIEQQRARDLRAESWTLQEIADELGVSRSSASVWVRDVVFDPKPRQRPIFRNPSSLHLQKLAEIEEMNEWGREQIGHLSDDAFLAAGTALYAGEGGKTDGAVSFANCDPEMIRFFCAWLRHYFDVDESRLRIRLYLHQGLDLDAAIVHWSDVTGIPPTQFGKPYRAVPDPSIRRAKHEFGFTRVDYCCSRTHRRVMGLVRALLSSPLLPG